MGESSISKRVFVAGTAHITNAGLLVGDVGTGSQNDVFTDFKLVGTKIINGSVAGVINLGGGGDHVNGGANRETVIDSKGVMYVESDEMLCILDSIHNFDDKGYRIVILDDHAI